MGTSLSENRRIGVIEYTWKNTGLDRPSVNRFLGPLIPKILRPGKRRVSSPLFLT